MEATLQRPIDELTDEPTYEPAYDKAEMVELVVDAQAGDRWAFDQLIRRFEGIVFATIYKRLGNRADAQELCQDFLQAMRKLDQLQDPRCFSGWLRSIAVRMSINRAVRSRPMFSAEPQTLENDCVEYDTPLVKILTRERQTQVHQGLGRLGELDRDTLVAFYFDGCSLIEMSDQFQSPIGTIKRRLHVARKRLAKELATMAPA